MRFSRENTDRSPAADTASARGWSKSLVQAVSSGVSSLLPGPKVADTPRVPFIWSGYDVVRIIAAVVLLVAAGLKTHQLATEPILGTSILDSRWLLMATVEFELFFGLWLLANILPRATWAAALGLFGLFTCVSVYKALSGAASCGCFGRVEVNPWYTTTLDLAIVISLLRWRPRHLPSLFSRGTGGQTVLASFPRITALLILWLVVGLPVVFAMGSYVDTTLSEAGVIIGDGKVVVLKPEQWTGKKFPLLDYIDVGKKFQNGEWLVMLYRRDCPHCQDAIQDLPRMSRELGIQQIAIIQMPPYLPKYQGVTKGTEEITHGQLIDSWEWFAKTPLILSLQTGVVKEIYLQSASAIHKSSNPQGARSDSHNTNMPAI